MPRMGDLAASPQNSSLSREIEDMEIELGIG